MICWEGRNAYWNDVPVIVLGKSSGGRIKVAKRSNTRMVFHVKPRELVPTRQVRLVDWLRSLP